MRLNDSQLDELMANARWTYIQEINRNVLRISNLIVNCGGKLSTEDMEEILRFFHSLNGTASTLGLERLADLGKQNECNLKELCDLGKSIDQESIKDIAQAIELIKYELNYIRPFKQQSDIHSDFNQDYTSISDMGKILLIDDDVIMLKLLESAFASEGYTVYICEDPLAAMDIIAVSKPDVILLDILMPECDGYEILRKIKMNVEYSDICIVFLSAVDDVEQKIKGMKMGIDDYITKPFVVKEVISRIEMILRRANKYQEKLIYDDLTTAYSRYYFNERIKDELQRFKRSQTIFSLAFIDLDYFKKINDTYGHHVGDIVLKKFVSYTVDNLRESDCMFRYGGEEFVVLLPDVDEKQAYAAIDRLREEFSKQPVEFGRDEFQVTFSAGVKQVDEKDKTVSQLISRVDQAMYGAKRNGRNKVLKFTDISQQDQCKKTLLLVDDESTILKLLSDHLSEVGYNVTMVTDGQEALGLAATQHFDGIILDLVLPDISGLEVCRRIKEKDFNQSTKIIILSKKKAEQDIVKGLELGADDYVTKPFSMAELEARVKRVLNR